MGYWASVGLDELLADDLTYSNGVEDRTNGFPMFASLLGYGVFHTGLFVSGIVYFANGWAR